MQRLACWERTFEDIAIFKWGVSAVPENRWRNPTYGYLKDNMWLCMDVVHAADAETCRQLETCLIASTFGVQGCQNLAPGGEGVTWLRASLPPLRARGARKEGTSPPCDQEYIRDSAHCRKTLRRIGWPKTLRRIGWPSSGPNRRQHMG